MKGFGGGLGPDKGFGIGVVLFEVAVDGGLEVDDALEDTGSQTPSCQDRKETFDSVAPRGGRRGEMEHPPGVAAQPGLDLRMFVGGVTYSMIAWTASPSGTLRSMALRKRMNA